MHSLAVREQDDSKELSLGLWNVAPPSYATVGLNDLPNRRFDCALNPFVPNHRAIGAPTNRLEVRRGFTVQPYQNATGLPSRPI